MSPQQGQRIAMTATADDAPEVMRLICDFPGWQITYDTIAHIWSAERKLSASQLELHCAYVVDELRAKLAQSS
jgi:hypothetical protein